MCSVFTTRTSRRASNSSMPMMLAGRVKGSTRSMQVLSQQMPKMMPIWVSSFTMDRLSRRSPAVFFAPP